MNESSVDPKFIVLNETYVLMLYEGLVGISTFLGEVVRSGLSIAID